jgi:hypothetical protein
MTALMVQSLVGNDPEMLSHLGAVVRTFREVQTWGLYPSSGAHRAARGWTARCSISGHDRLTACRPIARTARRARRPHGGATEEPALTVLTIWAGGLGILERRRAQIGRTTGGTGMLRSLGSWLTVLLTMRGCGRTSGSGSVSTARSLSTTIAVEPVSTALPASRLLMRSSSRRWPTGVTGAGCAASRRTTSITSSRSRRAGRTPSATSVRSAGRATARRRTGGRIHQRRSTAGQ